MTDTTLKSAVEHCADGLNSFNRFRADAMQHIDASIAADANYCLPKVVKAHMLLGAGDDQHADKIAVLVKQSRDLLPPGSSRESNLLDAVVFAREGRGVESATILEKLLIESPTDLYAHTLAQEATFWLGQPQWMLDIVERAAPQWTASNSDYSYFVSARAFAHEECGNFDAAERFGREAVEIDPSDVWGAHAVAHVLDMKGEMNRGIDWLESLSGHWGHANQMRHHLWWHLCLFLLELGEYDRVINLLSTEIRNPASVLIQQSPAATVDINNYASLLMRLELYGVEVSSHWEVLSNICAARVTNHGSAFSNVHDMMVLTSTGLLDKAKQLLCSMRERYAAVEDITATALSYTAVGIPVCEALLAYRSKDYAQVLSKLGGVRHQLHLMGASHAQRDVFYHLLVHAAEHEQQDDLRNIYMCDIERLGFCEVPARAAYRNKTH